MQEKIVTIEEQDVTVRELATDDVCTLFDTPEGNQMIYDLMLGNPTSARKLMRKSVQLSDTEFDRVTKGINAFARLDDAFREVNADFFDLLPKKAGAIASLGGALGITMDHTSKSRAASLKKGI